MNVCKAPVYPGDAPGKTAVLLGGERAVLENQAVRCEWELDGGRIAGLRLEHRESHQVARFDAGGLPRVRLAGDRLVDLATLQPASPLARVGSALVAQFEDADSGLSLHWSAALDDESNAVIQSLELTASAPTSIDELVFLDAALPGVRQVGDVDGSVVVCGDIFMAVEHPLAQNVVEEAGHVRCALPAVGQLAAGQSRTYTSVIGVAPPGQLRRGFLHYLERRRIHPYRQFLHYNNWYDVVLARPTERMTESEALHAIEYFGRELVAKRGATLDAVVWDDGWDDFNTLWGFHKGFPDGFRNLVAAAEQYGIAQGVWLSPNGGYATAKEKRIAYGKPLGFETNDRGFAMGGPNYRKAFHDACLGMMRDNGVVFFKFDGMGEGGEPNGATGPLARDIHAILELSRDLHAEKPDVYVSATCGTWASPFWLLFADSIWRQGMDSGHHGAGDTRQQWMTYRDMFCYERVVQVGALYPLNALMLHGIMIGDRPNRAPSGLAFDEKSVADEVWSFFGSGTCLQELYVSPDVPTDTMLDELAAAARWARANEDVLVDTHWVGGNPGKGEVYGWAAWRPGKGLLVLRNPAERPQTFAFTLKDVLELPEDARGKMTLSAVYPQERELPAGALDVARGLEITLQPFETIVMELCRYAHGERPAG